ncbi:MAG: phosphotransferase enzyme family protein [Bdellovibrionales bacterium]
MSEEFEDLSYRRQLLALRKLAGRVLLKFPVSNYKVKFINHGENTTYKISAKTGDFLLRLHRVDYHSEKAIEEELAWLERLSSSGEIKVPRAQKSLEGKSVIFENSKEIPKGKLCTLMSWQKGSLIKRNAIGVKDLFKHGELLGKLHDQSKNGKVKHRNYWSSDGLIGVNPKLGSILALKRYVAKKEFALISEIRKLLHKRLSQYELNNPDKFGLIHVDLHFSNVVWSKGEVYPIDFDDCGYGAYAWDIAIVLHSLDACFKGVELRVMVDAFLNGYMSIRNLDFDDFKVLEDFRVARKLVLMGWLQARFDNEKLKEYFYSSLRSNLKEFEAYT